MSHLSRRLGALVATSALALTGLTLLAVPAQAASNTPVDDVGTWLSGQLTDGLLHYPDSGFGAYDDYGLSIDAGFSLAQIGGHASAVDSIRDAIESAVAGDNYITGEAFGDTGSTYASALAKTLAFAERTGATPTSFGGKNLVTRLEAQVVGAGAAKGRIFDTTPVFGTDYAGIIGQSFAARGLAGASSAKAASALSYLLKLQCSNGGFKLGLPDKASTNQTCAGTTGGLDPDATAIVIIQLAPLRSNPAVATALAKTKTWLLSRQKADGSFGGGAMTEASNSNSTGLAALALGVMGDCTGPARAATWVKGLQVPQGTVGPLATEVGAIAYDASAYAAGSTDGITAGTLDQWRRTTAPTAASLLHLLSSAPDIAISGPTGFVRAGERKTFTLTGLDNGDRACISGPLGNRAVYGTGVAQGVSLAMPSTTQKATFRLTSSDDAAAAVVTVLARKVLTVDAARFRVARGSRLGVLVRGLVPGEHVTLKDGASILKEGVADQNGWFFRYVRLTGPLGRHTVVALGQFPVLRRGADTVKVVR